MDGGGQVLGKDLLSMAQLSGEALELLLRRAQELKAQHKAGLTHHLLEGQVLALVFQKPSLRTRVSFELAMRQLGGGALYLSPAEIKLGEREGVADAARVLSRYAQGIVARTYLHRDVEALARYADVPVVNGLSDREHPCQILADLLTLRERFASLRGRTLAYVGDGNNVVHSLLYALPGVGMDLRIATPPGYEPDAAIVREARALAAQQGTLLELSHEPERAVEGVDAIYTDAWYSMGQEDQHEARLPIFRPFQVNARLVRRASPGAVVMHCLPAHRGEEITDEVLDGLQCVALDQAENRLHAQKALLAVLLGERSAVGSAAAST
ncbi:MAG: ornithine carbamoyltransferase [Chloroflexi bacterium]|nr:ornithine carbamoyltransferase [Chloroflexota bacterium]